MKNIPEKIYLQIDADGETPEDFKGLNVSWCQYRINDNDLVYVRETFTMDDLIGFKENQEEYQFVKPGLWRCHTGHEKTTSDLLTEYLKTKP